MKRFVLSIDIPSRVRDSVHIAQMLREAAAVIDPQVVVMEHRHVYDRYGVQKYEWEIGDPAAPIDQSERRRAG